MLSVNRHPDSYLAELRRALIVLEEVEENGSRRAARRLFLCRHDGLGGLQEFGPRLLGGRAFGHKGLRSMGSIYESVPLCTTCPRSYEYILCYLIQSNRRSRMMATLELSVQDHCPKVRPGTEPQVLSLGMAAFVGEPFRRGQTRKRV